MDKKLKKYITKYMELCKMMNEAGQKDRKINIAQRKALKKELKEIIWILAELEEL